MRQKKTIDAYIHAPRAISLAEPGAANVTETGVCVELMKIESDPNFDRNRQCPQLPLLVPFRSTVQLPFPENGASVTSMSLPTLDRHQSGLYGALMRIGRLVSPQ